MRRTHSHSPSPAPSSTPYLQQHAPPPPNAPQGRKNGEGGEETGQGERDEEKERKKGKESLRLFEAPVKKIILQMHTAAHTSLCWSRQTQHGIGVCIWSESTLFGILAILF